MSDKTKKTLDMAVAKFSEEMQRNSTRQYFQELDKTIHRMLLRELIKPIEDPMRPFAGVKYARFIECGNAHPKSPQPNSPQP